MLRYLLFLPAVILLGCFSAFGQNEEDVLRYSDLLPGGTARTWGLGGAIGAVGADPGSGTTNPAGFGLYNTSEFSFTPQFEVNNTKDLYYGTNSTATDNQFSAGNVSMILSSPSSKGGAWRGSVFGISFDRQASYHWEQHAVGDAVPSTILQKFVNEAEGTPSNQLAGRFPFSSNLVWETFGIDPLDENDTLPSTYKSAIPFGSNTRQDHTISTSGRSNNTSFFYAANYMDRLYIGANVGFSGVRYERETSHKESSLDTTAVVTMKDLEYSEKLLTTGSGLDLKVGVIGRVGEKMRLGFAFHSPRWLQLSDAYAYSMSTNFRTPDINGNYRYSKDSPDGVFNYRVRTPWNVLLSAAYVAGKNGLVSIDYGYTNFRQAKLNKSLDGMDTYDFSMENEAVKEDFRSTHSLRVGTEWRSGPWYFRGGWGIWPSAYADSDTRQGTSYIRYTGGVGYRTKHMSMDFTAVYGTRDINYYQYDPALVAPSHERMTDTRTMLTLAYRP